MSNERGRGRRRRDIGAIEGLEARALLTHILGLEHPTWLPEIPPPIDRASLSEEAWGESGRALYPAAAATMSARNSNRPQESLSSAEKSALRPYFGSLVDRVRISYGADPLNEWNGPFGSTISLGGADADAQTYGLRIYVKSSKENMEQRERLRLLIHELVHADQYEDYGSSLGNFGYHYFKGYKRANQTYADNKMEVEAYLRENSLIEDVYERYAATLQPQFCLVGTDAYVTLYNDTTTTLSYQFRWHSDQSWTNYSVSVGAGRTHYIDTRCGEIARFPEIRYDGNRASGYQERAYRLDYENQPDSVNGNLPKGKLYEFKSDSNEIELFFKQPTPPVNRSPSMSVIGGKTVTHGQTLVFTARATDPDRNAINFSLSGAPSGATIHEDTGEFRWRPSGAQGPGTYTVTVVATDNGSPNRTDSEVVTIVVAPGADDRFEPNDSQGQATNLGVLAGLQTITGLEIQDDDWFSFQTRQTGGPGDYVRINFTHSQGDLDMKLVAPGGASYSSAGSSNAETISLNGKPAGVYYVQIFGYQGTTNPLYSLTIDAPSSTTATDYDGDTRDDLAVFRPSNGRWYIRTVAGSVLLNDIGFGLSGDVPVPGDYTGDGKLNVAVYRPSNGTWYARSQPEGFLFNGTPWGLPGDIPVPGDYDGDGVDDLGVYRPSSGTWYVRTVSGSVRINGAAWGLPTDVAVPGDYDGDGRTDLGVYRPSNGTWYVRTAGGSVILNGAPWGLPGDIAVTGDYDGDGRDDLGVYRPSTGQWFARSVAGGILVDGTGFGLAGDVPVPGDYDGDGLANVAVYRPSTGQWFVRLEGGGFVLNGSPWGLAGDIPVSATVAERAARATVGSGGRARPAGVMASGVMVPITVGSVAPSGVMKVESVGDGISGLMSFAAWRKSKKIRV